MLDRRIDGVLTDWKAHYASLFGQHPLRLQHRLADTGLFTDEALESILENVDRQDYHVNYMDPNTGVRREGEFGKASGKEILDAVKSGNIWINLRAPGRQNPAFDDMLRAIYDDFEKHVPGLKTYKQNMTILISSPNVQVKYHVDVPGQSLWQVRGRKKVFVYPAEAPFLSPNGIEKVVINEAHETDIQFQEWYDDYATIYDLEPGEMLHWPLNCPHRVDNYDCMNVSVTTEHWTDALRNKYAVNFANGMLRKMGMNNLDRGTRGLKFYTKLALAGAVKFSGIQRKDVKPYTVDFAVDPNAPDGVKDITAYQFTK